MNEIAKLTDTISIGLDRNPAVVYLASLGTENSREGMRWCLNLAASVLSGGRYDAFSLDWSQLRYHHIGALKSKLLSVSPSPTKHKPYSISTVNLIISGVKGVMKQCKKLHLISPQHLTDILDEKGVRGQSLPAGRALSPQEVKALFLACSSDLGGVRDKAVLAILLGAGLRRSELSSLDVRDWHEDNLLITIRQGKGGKAREIPVGERVGHCMYNWLGVRGNAPGPLILSIRRGGVVRPTRLLASGVYFLLERRSLDAGIARVTPHDCRRTYITNLLLNGADLATAARLAGHASVETTAIYDRRGFDSMREATEGLILPV